MGSSLRDVALGLAVTAALGCGSNPDASPGSTADASATDISAPDLPSPDVSSPTTDAGAPSDIAVDLGAPPPPSGPPTYWRDVAPILRARCGDCHVESGVGPFTLTSYADARDRAALLVNVTEDRRMPPWPASSTCRPLQAPRVLTDAEISTLRAWYEADTPEGDPASYREPEGLPDALPAPDFTARAAMPYVPPTTATDDYRCFVIDPGWTERHSVTALRVVPGEPRTVHHLNVFEVKAAAVEELQRVDDRDPGEGYRCFSGPGVSIGSAASLRVQMIAGWAPGTPLLRTPPGTAIRVDPGSRIVLQVHYNQLSHRGLPDRSRVDLWFSDRDSRRQAMVIPVTVDNFSIPAGASDHPVERSLSPRDLGIPLNFTLYGVYGHMHGFGRSFHAEVQRAADGGATDCMLDIPRWNFHWQQFYMFDEPVRIGPDDRVRVQCRFDNSPANQPVIDGVQRQPVTVREGSGTLDEMCMGFFYVTFL